MGLASHTNEVTIAKPLGVIYQRANDLCIDAVVKNSRGLHLRPSRTLAEIATKYENTIVNLEVGDTVLPIRGEMDVISLTVEHGTQITFSTNGHYASNVLNELYAAVETINHRTYDGPEEPEEEF